MYFSKTLEGTLEELEVLGGAVISFATKYEERCRLHAEVNSNSIIREHVVRSVSRGGGGG